MTAICPAISPVAAISGKVPSSSWKYSNEYAVIVLGQQFGDDVRGALGVEQRRDRGAAADPPHFGQGRAP